MVGKALEKAGQGARLGALLARQARTRVHLDITPCQPLLRQPLLQATLRSGQGCGLAGKSGGHGQHQMPGGQVVAGLVDVAQQRGLLVVLAILLVGEALRDAFDPKKYTIYQ